MMTMGTRAALAAAALVVAVAGCGGGDDEAKSKTVTVAERDGGAASPSAEHEGREQESSAQAEPEEELASGEGSDAGVRFRFVLTQLKRSGDTVEAGGQVEYLGGDDTSFQISESFSDGVSRKLTNGQSEESFNFDGIALIDTKGRRKYLVARDETGACVCSNNLSAQFAAKDAPVSLTATLSAPPEGVNRVDVVIPSVKTFTDVPIEG